MEKAEKNQLQFKTNPLLLQPKSKKKATFY